MIIPPPAQRCGTLTYNALTGQVPSYHAVALPQGRHLSGKPTIRPYGNWIGKRHPVRVDQLTRETARRATYSPAVFGLECLLALPGFGFRR